MAIGTETNNIKVRIPTPDASSSTDVVSFGLDLSPTKPSTGDTTERDDFFNVAFLIAGHLDF
jgi:hypothetical protein